MVTHSSILAWRIPMDRGAWWATVLGVTESRTQPSNFTFTFTFKKSIEFSQYVNLLISTPNQNVLLGDAQIKSVYHVLMFIQPVFCWFIICEFTGLKLHVVVGDHEWFSGNYLQLEPALNYREDLPSLWVKILPWGLNSSVRSVGIMESILFI